MITLSDLVANLPISTRTYTPMEAELPTIQVLAWPAEGHFDMWTEGAKHQTTNPMINGQATQLLW